jgi:hypothetical protein
MNKQSFPLVWAGLIAGLIAGLLMTNSWVVQPAFFRKLFTQLDRMESDLKALQGVK